MDYDDSFAAAVAHSHARALAASAWAGLPDKNCAVLMHGAYAASVEPYGPSFVLKLCAAYGADWKSIKSGFGPASVVDCQERAHRRNNSKDAYQSFFIKR